MPAGSEQLQRVQVDVLVGACGAIDVMVARGELRWIEHDQVELRALPLQRPQRIEGVGVVPRGRFGRQAVQLHVLAREAQRVARGVDRMDRRGAAGEHRHREAARVAEAVERAGAAAVEIGEFLRQATREIPVLALVDVVAGLVSAAYVDEKPQPVLRHLDHVGRLGAREHPIDRRQPFTRPGRPVGPVEHVGAARRLHQRRDQVLAPRVDAGTLELRDQLIRVAVDDQPGQSIRLAEDQTQCGARRRQLRPRGDRRAHALAQERGVDHVAFREAPRARTDR